MGRRSLRAGAIALVLALAGLGGPAPAADTSASIAHVQRSGQDLQILVNVPPDATVDLGDVSVTIEGADATATASKADSTTVVRRTAVLAIDTSNSMQGARFAAAKDAAKTFLDTVPDDVYVGIVAFNGTVIPALSPTQDRKEAALVVDNLKLNRETLLYDGVLGAVRMAGTVGQRSVLVLSDGADTSSTKLSEATGQVRDSGVILDAVALDQGSKTPKPLASLASAGNGKVISASSGALRQTLSAEADILARQVLVTATVPDSVTASEGTVSVTLGSSTGPLNAQAFTLLGKRTKPTSPSPTPEPAPVVPVVQHADPVSSTWLYAGLGALLLGLGLALVLLLAPGREKQMTAAERAVAYVEHVTGGRDDPEKAEAGPALPTTTAAAEEFLARNSSLEQRIADRLDGAGSDLKPAEWFLLHTGIFLTAGFIGIVLGGGNVVMGMLFLAFGALGPWTFLGMRRSRRRKKFEQLLPDTLQLMSGSLSAGLSLAQSVDTVSKEGQEPVSSEFRRVLVETRLGISLEDALEGVSERFESKDFSWVVMAIKIQRQVGGNLAELLDTVAGTIREREYMRRQVAALAAEGKMSAYVLGGLPPGFMAYLFISNRPYVMLFFTEPIGWAMLAGMMLLLGLGVFWMMKLVKVEL